MATGSYPGADLQMHPALPLCPIQLTRLQVGILLPPVPLVTESDVVPADQRGWVRFPGKESGHTSETLISGWAAGLTRCLLSCR